MSDEQFGMRIACDGCGNRRIQEIDMETLAMMFPMAAAGWAFLVWLCGGGFGLAFVVFIVLKLLGK